MLPLLKMECQISQKK